MSTRRRIEFELVGNAGNIAAVLRGLESGITSVGRGMQGVNREGGLMANQFKAIGTTARYALAGGIVFGLTGAISRLSDFNNQLGTMASLVGTVTRQGNYNAPGGSTLSALGDQALLASTKLGIATDDVQNYMTRFLSAFDVRGTRGMTAMSQFVDEVGRLQATLGTEAGDPQQLAGGIASLVKQIDPSGRNIGGNTNRVANLIGELLRTTPNITGRDVSRDIGRVGSSMGIANMTPEQAFAVWAVAGRAGGSSSVIGRGISQLLSTSLLHPKSPAQLRAFSTVGLPTDSTTLRNMGGWQVLMRMMAGVAPNGLRLSGRTKAMLNDENVDDSDAVARLRGTGINLTLLYNLLGRQESVRQFVNLLGQGGVRALRDYIDSQQRATQANLIRQREDAALNQRSMSQFRQSTAAISLSAVRGLTPVFQHFLTPGAQVLARQTIQHRRVVEAIEAGVGGTILAGGVANLWRSFRKGRPGAMGATLASAAIATEELPNVLAGGAPTGARDNPYWVIISPLSRAVGGITDGGGGGGAGTHGKNPVLSALQKFGPAAAARIGAGGLGEASLAGTGVGIPLAVLLIAAQMGGKTGRTQHNNFERAMDQTQYGRFPVMPPLYKDGHLTGAMDVSVRLVDSQGREIHTETKKGVPTKFALSPPGAPTYQGKTGSKKGGR